MLSASGVSLNKRKVKQSRATQCEIQTPTKIWQFEWWMNACVSVWMLAFGKITSPFCNKIRLHTEMMKNVHRSLSAIVNNIERERDKKILHSMYVVHVMHFLLLEALKMVVCKRFWTNNKWEGISKTERRKMPLLSTLSKRRKRLPISNAKSIKCCVFAKKKPIPLIFNTETNLFFLA